MCSSRGFASTAPNLFALFRLAFASAARQRRLTLLVTVSRRIIMQKARHHPWATLRYKLSPPITFSNRVRLQIADFKLQIEMPKRPSKFAIYNLKFAIELRLTM
jgi:hypothetical protein